MPQLDISTYASQLFWLFICFGLLYLFTSRVSSPLIGGVLKERRQRIEGALRQGLELQMQSEVLRAEFERVLADKRTQANQMLVSCVHDITIFAENRKKESSEAVIVRIRKSQDEIDKRKEESNGYLKSEAAVIASDVVQKLAGIKADKDKIAANISQMPEAV